MVAYKEFRADEAVINCMQTSNGQSRILFLGTGEGQGMRSQTVELYAVQGNQWVNIPIDIMENVPIERREALEGNCFCYMAGERMAVVYEDDLPISYEENTNPTEIIAILVWNPDTEQFVLE